MKKFLIIFILLQVASNNAFAEELIKFPSLVIHYKHHSSEHKDSKNFFQFLHAHYCDEHSKSRHSDAKHDEDKDCNLPFKHCNGCCLTLHSTLLTFAPTLLDPANVPLQLQKMSFLISNDRIDSLDVCTIWQPPKLS